VINGRALGRRVTGVERYTAEVVHRLGDRVRVIQPGSAAQGPAGHLWEQLFLPLQLSRGEILWSPANSGPLQVEQQVVTIHDLGPLEHPEWFRPAFARFYRMLLPRLVARARAVIVPSRYTKTRLLEIFGCGEDKITIIPEGVDRAHFYPRQRVEIERLRVRWGLPENFILAVGSLQPRKNISGLLAAWKLVESNSPSLGLILVGTYGDQFTSQPAFKNRRAVRFLGYVPDEDLPGLYSAANGYVCASFEEGFGLTVLEAMACGTPVIASRSGGLPDLLDQSGLLFDPYSPDELAVSIERLVDEPGLQAELASRGYERAKGFTWRNTAEMVWELLDAVA
jgi:glycosyltransferase involved in cell wall biosynthesis